MSWPPASSPAGTAVTDSIAEGDVLADADERARRYVAGIGHRPVFPSDEAVRNLDHFDEPLPAHGAVDADTLRLLDEYGTPAIVESNGGRYFGFVVGASLPAAAAADRLVLAWDNGALGHVT